MISMIAAVGKNLELGKNNNLIWHIPADMKFFKKTTMGHIVVMGRKTYESIPGGLPGREIIVISTRPVDSDIEVYDNINIVVDKYKNNDIEIFICGGASIYKQFLPYADKMYLTEIESEDREADTFFPEFDRKEWKRRVLSKDEHKGTKFKMCLYDRKIM